MRIYGLTLVKQIWQHFKNSLLKLFNKVSKILSYFNAMLQWLLQEIGRIVIDLHIIKGKFVRQNDQLLNLLFIRFWYYYTL